jgi:hypothetical protein
MKKIEDLDLVKVNGGMTCEYLFWLMRVMRNGNQQTAAQAQAIANLLLAGYHLCD